MAEEILNLEFELPKKVGFFYTGNLCFIWNFIIALLNCKHCDLMRGLHTRSATPFVSLPAKRRGFSFDRLPNAILSQVYSIYTGYWDECNTAMLSGCQTIQCIWCITTILILLFNQHNPSSPSPPLDWLPPPPHWSDSLQDIYSTKWQLIICFIWKSSWMRALCSRVCKWNLAKFPTYLGVKSRLVESSIIRSSDRL